MEKEHKDLLITDLSGRLPHKVIVEFVSYEDEEKPWIGELSCKDLDCFIHDVGFVEIKPYLFPISSMTAEQRREYTHIANMYGNLGATQLSGTTIQDWFDKNHLDYRGLIPKGLAKDATGLNIY
jgi:hypothetical protein